jgi:lipid-binding SYLF domain-containing protein
MKKLLLVAIVLVGFVALTMAPAALADNAKVLSAKVDSTLAVFKATKGSDAVLKQAEGLLVFPAITKAGFIFGGEYGEGALIVNDEIKGFYNTIGGSFGFQIGAQRKSLILAFMDPAALKRFEDASGWKIGADASVAVVAVGADGSIDTSKLNQPIIAFVFDQKGLMGNLTLEGAKISPIKKK